MEKKSSRPTLRFESVESISRLMSESTHQLNEKQVAILNSEKKTRPLHSLSMSWRAVEMARSRYSQRFQKNVVGPRRNAVVPVFLASSWQHGTSVWISKIFVKILRSDWGSQEFRAKLQQDSSLIVVRHFDALDDQRQSLAGDQLIALPERQCIPSLDSGQRAP